MGDERRITVELCPVCDKSNIAGHKWCVGRPHEPHFKSRFEFTEVVRASVLEERDRTIEHLREREAYFAKVLHVADGGQYRADWAGRLQDIVAEIEVLRSQLTEIEQVIGSRLEADEALGVIVNIVRDGLVPAPQDREPA